MRSLDESEFPTDAVRLIARKLHGKLEADVRRECAEMLRIIRVSIAQAQ